MHNLKWAACNRQMLMYHRGEYEIYCHQHKMNQCELLVWTEMMLPNKTPGVSIYCKYAKKYSIFACRPVKKETLKDIRNNMFVSLWVFWTWIDCVSVEGTFEHVWCTVDNFFIMKLITVTYRGKRQVKSSALCLETIKMKTYSIHSQVIKGEKKQPPQWWKWNTLQDGPYVYR